MRVCNRCGEMDASKFYASSSACWCKQCYHFWYADRRGGYVSRVCGWCAEEFDTLDRRKVYCTRECKDAAKNRARQDAINALKPERSCLHCGVTIERHRRVNAKFCSERCNSAAHQATRKARWRAGEADYVSRAYIIDRDRSMCHLCGRRCKSGEIQLDHVVPLSCGGTHEASNLRVAHARCNLAKQAAACNEQLLLIG